MLSGVLPGWGSRRVAGLLLLSTVIARDREVVFVFPREAFGDDGWVLTLLTKSCINI